jgi:hypothetical protein
MIHDLLCDTQPFQKMLEGVKNFEVRHTRDRDFAVGDELRLHEQTEDRSAKTGRIFQAKVVYILRGPAYELPADVCVMQLFGGFLTLPKNKY